MNHPSHEEWMAYLYDEAPGPDRLAAHLAVCPDCKQQVADWRAARTGLDAWSLNPVRRRLAPARPWIRWAAAAALLLGIGLGIGRLSSAPLSAERLRADLEPRLRRELRVELERALRDEWERSAAATLASVDERTKRLLSDYAKELEASRAANIQALNTALDRMESQRLADFVSLKKDVDTLAFRTESGLRRAQQEIVQLADYTQPASGSK